MRCVSRALLVVFKIFKMVAWSVLFFFQEENSSPPGWRQRLHQVEPQPPLDFRVHSQVPVEQGRLVALAGSSLEVH